MVSKKDLFAMIEFLNGDITALENEIDTLKREIKSLKKVCGCKCCPKKVEKKPEKRGRGRPRKNA